MTTYDDETARVANAIRPLLQYEADLVDCFRQTDGPDAGQIFVVLRGRDNDEMMLKLC